MKLYTSFLFISIYISICNMEMCKYSNSVISISQPHPDTFGTVIFSWETILIRNVIKNCTNEEYEQNRADLHATFDVPLTVELDIGPYITQIVFVFHMETL